MQNVAILISDPAVEPLTSDHVDEACDALRSAGGAVGSPDWLAPERACQIDFGEVDWGAATSKIRTSLAGRPIDVAAVPAANRRKQLFISDMDATIVDCETLDDLAEFADVREAVAAITRQSMNGEVDFVDALVRRVAMLEGLPAAMLETAFERVRLMPGARTLIHTLRAWGVHTVLVSGGFTYFTTRVARLVGFEEHEANVLEIENGRLTGRIVPPIINRDGKRNALIRISTHRGIAIEDTLAVGDGANDLGMIEQAGLGVAYQGKKIVAERAPVRIDHTDLTSLLFLQGYRLEQFVD
jgi:phosphoserine phosphatase